MTKTEIRQMNRGTRELARLMKIANRAAEKERKKSEHLLLKRIRNANLDSMELLSLKLMLDKFLSRRDA